MPVLRVEGLSLDEAEETVAFVWELLEANDIDTPHLVTRNHGGVELVFSFASREAAELVTRELQGKALAARTVAAD